MDIPKKVYRYTWIYVGTILLTGLFGSVVSVFPWWKSVTAILLFLFGVWSTYICIFFYKTRGEFVTSENKPLSYISWGYQWKRIIGSAVLAVFAFLTGAFISVYILMK